MIEEVAVWFELKSSLATAFFLLTVCTLLISARPTKCWVTRIRGSSTMPMAQPEQENSSGLANNVLSACSLYNCLVLRSPAFVVFSGLFKIPLAPASTFSSKVSRNCFVIRVRPNSWKSQIYKISALNPAKKGSEPELSYFQAAGASPFLVWLRLHPLAFVLPERRKIRFCRMKHLKYCHPQLDQL